jgi:hypothetical protein
MKGYELYSWEAGGEWYFALLAGTNRLKTRGEVRSPKNRLRGVAALGRELSRLAEGEEVFWAAGRVPGTALPPGEVIEEVKKICARRKVVLGVEPAKSKRRASQRHLRDSLRIARLSSL